MKTRLLRISAAAALALTCFAPAASAALTRIAGPVNLLHENRTVVKFDVAFDTKNKVYLMAWGTQAAGPVNGQFLSETGAPIGAPFAISSTDVAQSGWARVLYSAEQSKFIVSYVKIVGANVHQKAARLVTYAGGSPSLSHEIFIAQWAGGAGTESGMAYSGGHFLVTWWRWDTNQNPVSYVTLIDGNGQLAGMYQLTNPGDGQSDPEIACDAASNRCLVIGVAWGAFVQGFPSSAWGRFINATTGVPEGPDSFYIASSPDKTPLEDETIAPLGAGNRFLAGYAHAGVVHGQLVTPATSTVGAAYVMRQGGAGTGYGGTSLIHNSGSSTTALVTLSFEGLVSVEEIDANGASVAGSFDLIPNPRGDGKSNYWDFRSKFGIGAANATGKQFLVLDNDSWFDVRVSRYSTDGVGCTVGCGGGGPAPAQVSMTASATFPATVGVPVTWTASASGGTAPLQYQFWIYSSDTGWTVGQAYSTVNGFTWAPAPGTHAVQVWVRSSGSTAAYDAYTGGATFAVELPKPRVSALNVSTGFPAALNVPITFTASASGGAGAIEYQFWRFSEGVGWQLAQPYSSSNTYTTFPPAGVNDVQVWVRTVGSGVSYEDWKGTGPFTVASTPARLTGLTPDFAFDSPIGHPITFTATGTGGQGALEYKFYLYSYNTGTWFLMRDWSAANWVTWTPSPDTSGQYVVQAWIRTNGKAVLYEDWRQTSQFVITDSTSLSLSADRALVGLRAGDVVTWTAAVGGAGPWEYRFWTFDGVTWTTPGPQASNTFAWTLTAGSRAVQVWIRRPGTMSGWERWQGSNLFVVNP